MSKKKIKKRSKVSTNSKKNLNAKEEYEDLFIKENQDIFKAKQEMERKQDTQENDIPF